MNRTLSSLHARQVARPMTSCARTPRALLWALLACVAIGPAAQAASLQSFSGVVGGGGSSSIPAGCTSFGPPSSLSFYGGFAAQLEVPGGNTACGYSGTLSNLTSSTSTAPLINSVSLSPTLEGKPGFAQLFDGTASSRASFGSLGASAHGHYSGSVVGYSETALAAATGAASFSDTLTASVPTAFTDASHEGFVRYRFEIDGSMSAPGMPAAYRGGEALTAVLIQQDGGPAPSLIAANTYTGGTGYFSGAPEIGGGWTVVPGSISGASEFVSSKYSIDLTHSWDFKAGLIVNAFGNADDDFSSTAKLVGIDLFDAVGDPISDFSLSSASGTNYLATAVPEPTMLGLMSMGLALLVVAARRRRGDHQR